MTDDDATRDVHPGSTEREGRVWSSGGDNVVDSSTTPSGAGPRPTMRDVARLAEVSIKTVSRVVNEEGNVRARTMERVTAAIDQLGFQRNDLARSLRPGQSSSTVGLVVGDIGNPYFAGVVGGVEDIARLHGHMVVAGSTGEVANHERELVSTLSSRRVDGIIVVPAGEDHRHLEPPRLRGIPVVFVDRPPVDLSADAVLVDNRGAARDGVSALLDDGHRRVAVLADRHETYTTRERLAGYREAHGVRGLGVVDKLVRPDCGDVAGAEKATTELFETPDPPTAIFTINNRMSLGALRAMHQQRRHVPLLGFDELEFANLVQAKITLIAHDPRIMGQRAAELLFERLNSEVDDDVPPRRVVLPTTRIVHVPEGSA